MAVCTGRRHQRGDFVDQLQRREHQITRAVGAGLGVVVDQMFGIQLMQMRQRERRAGAVAQQSFQPCPVTAFDAHLGIQRETSAVFPASHYFSVVLADQAAPDEGTQDAPPHLCLHSSKRDRIKPVTYFGSAITSMKPI